MHEYCDIVDRDEITVVGIKSRLCAESRGVPRTHGMNTTQATAQKYAQNGNLKLLFDMFSGEHEIIGARTNIIGDGVYDFIFGIAVNGCDIPPYLPEYAETLVIPAKKYMRMAINTIGAPDRAGVPEQMIADEYFIQEFRTQTPYVFDKSGVSFNSYDETGNVICKYEPIKIPANDTERMDSFVCTPVVLPDINVACSVDGPDGEFVIFKYFKVEEQIYALDSAKMYNDDYYGFPINSVTETLKSAFGSRVSDFSDLPDFVEGHTVPGGLYLHIWQHEPNGDNPSMCYDAAFNHIGELFLDSHPEYERDNSKHVIARFRQANHASVFVPLIYKGKQ